MEDSHGALGVLIEIIPDAGLKSGNLDGVVLLRYANPSAELADGSRSEASSPHAGDGGKAGIVPAVHNAVGHKEIELSLRGEAVLEVEAAELVLMGLARSGDMLDDPVIEAPVVLELESAD